MVLGMSSRNNGDTRRSDTRRSTTQQHSKKERPPPPPPSSSNVTPLSSHEHKPKPPSAEQVTLANMLGDNTPSNIAELVSQILAVVRLPEEMITVALHDNDYDVEKSLEALLDSSNNTHDEWTTMSSRKGRKKQAEAEATEQKGRKGFTDGGKSGAAKHTRDGFGGSVTVEFKERSSSQRRGGGGGGEGGGGFREGKTDTSDDSSKQRDTRKDPDEKDGKWDSGNRRDHDREGKWENNSGRRRDGGDERRRTEAREGKWDSSRRDQDEREGRYRRREADHDRDGRWESNRKDGEEREGRYRRREGNHDGRRDNSRKESEEREGRYKKRDGDWEGRKRNGEETNRWDSRREGGAGGGGGSGRWDHKHEGRRRFDHDGQRETEGGDKRDGNYKRGGDYNGRRGFYDGRRDNYRGGGGYYNKKDTRRNRQQNQEQWDDEPVTIETTDHVQRDDAHETWSNDDWVIVDRDPPSPPPGPVTGITKEESMFPEALDTVASPTTSHQEETIYTEDKRSQSSPALLDDQSQKKTRRYKTSQIPSQPVEMPSYTVDSLKNELGALGIDFVGPEATPTTSVASPSSLLLSSGGTSDQLFTDIVPSPSQQVTNTPVSLLTSTHYTSSFSEDTAVIAISTGGLSTGFDEAPPTKLDPPPGLTHPSQHASNVPVATSNVPMATGGLLPPPTQSQHETVLGMSPQTGSGSGSNKLDELLTTSSTSSYPLTMNPVSLETPDSFPSVAQSQPLFTTQPTSVAMVTNPVPSHHVPPTTSSMMSSLNNKQSSHIGASNTGKVHGGSTGNMLPMAPPTAPTGMVYPHMLPQHFAPYGTPHMMLGQFYGQQPSSDSTAVLATAAVSQGLSREHSATSFGGDSKYDITSPVGGTNTQQQQSALQNFYGAPPYMYLYAPLTGYSAQMNHKAGGSSQYPAGTTYQQTPQAQYLLDDLYSGSMAAKNNSVSSTTGTANDFGSYTKHQQQQYDSKAAVAAGYGSYAMGAPPMGGYMMPAPPPMMTTPHDNSSRQKHKNFNSGWSHT